MQKKKSSRVRDPFDYYPTPSWCVHRLLEFGVLPSTKNVWLEPSAGDGNIIQAVSSFEKIENDNVIRFKPSWVAYEIQPRFSSFLEEKMPLSQIHIDNFLDLGSRHTLGVVPNVILGNPPYSHALEFVKKSMKLGADYICFLLRLSFLGSSERSTFMRQCMPDVYILPNRPSFSNKGTDTSEYGWFLWKRQEGGSYENPKGQIQILNNTPKEIRNPKSITSNLQAE